MSEGGPPGEQREGQLLRGHINDREPVPPSGRRLVHSNQTARRRAVLFPAYPP
jgi:hypothetical protein